LGQLGFLGSENPLNADKALQSKLGELHSVNEMEFNYGKTLIFVAL
jgi:hypothetical protein